jgi:3-hydroxyacyl-CoA dehydrogenase
VSSTAATADPTAESVVRYDLDGDVAVLTVDYPPVNALAAPMRDGLVLRLGTAFADPAVRAVVIIGARDRFIAGADIREFSQPRRGADLLTIQDMMEDAPKPVVAAIDGHALGGGLELALAAPYRIAAARAMLGLPEVNLGLLPGGGGTQRMTRLIGPADALELILSGRHVDALGALELGLVDAIAEGPLLQAAVGFARRKAELAPPFPKASARTDRTAGADPELFTAARRREGIRSRGMVAPFQIIDCVEAACTMAPAEGLVFEKQALARCHESPAMAAQVSLFFAERAAAKVEPPLAVTAQAIGAVRLEGAFAEILAFPLALAGIPVRIDAAVQGGDGLLARAKKQFAQELADRSLDRSALEAASRIITSTTPEVPDATIEITRQTVSGWAGSLRLPDTSEPIALRLHGPGAVPTVLEIGRAAEGQDDRPLATAIALARRIGIAPVIRGTGAAFGIGERLVEAYKRTLEALTESASPDVLARAVDEDGFQGRFAVGNAPDAIGIESRTDAETQGIAASLLAALAKEGATLLADGTARRASDIDFLSVIGLGFPRYRGGPMYAAEHEGLVS